MPLVITRILGNVEDHWPHIPERLNASWNHYDPSKRRGPLTPYPRTAKCPPPNPKKSTKTKLNTYVFKQHTVHEMWANFCYHFEKERKDAIKELRFPTILLLSTVNISQVGRRVRSQSRLLPGCCALHKRAVSRSEHTSYLAYGAYRQSGQNAAAAAGEDEAKCAALLQGKLTAQRQSSETSNIRTHIFFVPRSNNEKSGITSRNKALRPAISAQVLLGFPVSISEYWDGSQNSKLLLHASHAAPHPQRLN